MVDEHSKNREKVDRDASFGSALDEIGFKPLGKRIIIAQRVSRKPLIKQERGKPQHPDHSDSA